MQIFVDLHFLLKLIIFYEHKPVDIDQIKTFYFQKNFKRRLQHQSPNGGAHLLKRFWWDFEKIMTMSML